MVAAAAPGAGHQAAPAASASGASAPVASAGLSPSGTAHGLRMQAAPPRPTHLGSWPPGTCAPATACPRWPAATPPRRVVAPDLVGQPAPGGQPQRDQGRRGLHHPGAPRAAAVDRGGRAARDPEATATACSAPVQQAAPVAAAPAAAPAPVASSGIAATGGMSAFQTCVIQRESGGNPSAVNPSSGAGGLYQFLPSTWQALGHSGLPENRLGRRAEPGLPAAVRPERHRCLGALRRLLVTAADL